MIPNPCGASMVNVEEPEEGFESNAGWLSLGQIPSTHTDVETEDINTSCGMLYFFHCQMYESKMN